MNNSISNFDRQHMSFEVFPPKKEGELAQAFEILDELATLSPDFISVTYGAGGSKSKKTVELASYIQNKLSIPALAHLTCVGNKKEEILAVCRQLEEANVSNILSLRGDRPKDMDDETFASRDFIYASQMITYLSEHTHFNLLGACYPEKHYEAKNFDEDLNALLAKQEAGAQMLISQLFFDNEIFYRFVEKARNKGISIPIVAGIMPITTSKQLGTTVSLSGSSVPKTLADIIAKYDAQPEDMRKAGLDFAVTQILDLQNHNVNGIHLYTMNKPDTARYITQNTGK